VADPNTAIIKEEPQPLNRFQSDAPKALQNILCNMQRKDHKRCHGSMGGGREETKQEDVDLSAFLVIGETELYTTRMLLTSEVFTDIYVNCQTD
jgi:hypothetical protein